VRDTEYVRHARSRGNHSRCSTACKSANSWIFSNSVRPSPGRVYGSRSRFYEFVRKKRLRAESTRHPFLVSLLTHSGIFSLYCEKYPTKSSEIRGIHLEFHCNKLHIVKELHHGMQALGKIRSKYRLVCVSNCNSGYRYLILFSFFVISIWRGLPDR